MNPKSVALLVGLMLSTSPAFCQTGPACETQRLIHRAPPEKCEGMRFVLIRTDVPAVGKVVDTPSPQCEGPRMTSDYLATGLKAVVAYYTNDVEKLSRYTGNLYEMAGNDLNKGITKVAHELPGEAGAFMRRNAQARTDKGVCQTIFGSIPRRATLKGYHFYVNDLTIGPRGPCQPMQDCTFFRFFYPPQKVPSKFMNVYSTEVINWSDNLVRSSEMILYYTLPKGVTEITSLPVKSTKKKK